MTKTLDILDRLIAFPSISASSNLDIIDYINVFLTTRGFSVHQIPSPCGKKAGIFASIGPKDKPGILLSAHTDVVPTNGQAWTVDPFKLTRKDDRVYGRGTTDMKGYVASVLAVADKASKLTLREPLKIALSYDEEIGCVGIQEMIQHLEPTIGLPRACFVGEPTQMQVATGHKGKVALRAVCRGQSGHSALAPKYVNALHIATDFMTNLRNLQTELASNGNQDSAFDIPYSTIHVGKLNGGIALNVVPDTATLDLEIRHIAEDSSDQLIKDINDIAASSVKPYLSKFDKAKIEIEQINAYPGLAVSSAAEIVSVAKEYSQSHKTIKVAFGTEAGVFSQLGIPAIVCGPGSMEGQGHKPDEYLELDELYACDAMLDRLLISLKS